MNKIQNDIVIIIDNDPIELLKTVKEHSLNDQKDRNGMSIILD